LSIHTSRSLIGAGFRPTEQQGIGGVSFRHAAFGGQHLGRRRFMKQNVPNGPFGGERALGDTEKGGYVELLRQQTALARFGELALRSDDLEEILTEACRSGH
jgi:hypothetical protein